MYRAFYRPATGKAKEVFEDAQTLEELSPGAILIIQIYEDGTREVIEDESKKRSLTPKENRYHKWALRHLEFKHDGGDTPEMRAYLRENRGMR